MKTVLHTADSRGFFDHGWLRTHHTFSFADYYDPERINFGALRVLNDDTVVPGEGFGMHPHRNMEIVSIPLGGVLEHQDSLGHRARIRPGEIQVMSAGTGIVHSEYSADGTVPTEFLQIWVVPRQAGLKPRYEDISIREILRPNELATIVSPYDGRNTGPWIRQQAWFSFGSLKRGLSQTYELKSGTSFGVYVFVIEGETEAAGVTLHRRDGLGIYDTDSFSLRTLSDSTLLLIEVPDL